MFSSAETNLLVDVSRAVTTGFARLDQNRLLDTRNPDRVAAGSTTRVDHRSRGCPAGAVAAALNVNFAAGQTVANAAVATLGSGGEVCVLSSVETNLRVDLDGAFT